jgi:ketosteroid isomerase-like protein
MNIRRWSIAALSAFTLSALLVAASPKGKEPDFQAMQAEVDKAWCSLNAKNADPYYAKDPELTFFDLAPMKYKGWGEYLDGAQKIFLDGCKSMKFIPKGDDHIVRKGDVAWLTRTLRISAEMKEGKPLELDCRDTVLWVRYGEKWLIAHEHVSVPLPE